MGNQEQKLHFDQIIDKMWSKRKKKWERRFVYICRNWLLQQANLLNRPEFAVEFLFRTHFVIQKIPIGGQKNLCEFK